MISVLRKIFKNKLQKSFLRLSSYRNEKEVEKIVTRYMTILLNYKMKAFKNISLGKIKGASYRKKTIFNFSKLLNTLEKSKHFQWKSLAFNKIKLPFVHDKGVEGNM